MTTHPAGLGGGQAFYPIVFQQEITGSVGAETLYNVISLEKDAALYKGTIAHEMGHAIMFLSNTDVFGIPSWQLTDYGEPANGNCVAAGGALWGPQSREFQSAALVEGWADFYAAVTFNVDTVGADCYLFNPFNNDWDGDGSYTDEHFWVSCHAGPYNSSVSPNPDPPSFPVAASNYLEWPTGAQSCLVGAPYDDGVAVMYDWTRMFWAWHTSTAVTNLTVGQIAAVIDLANPDTWQATGYGTEASFPAQRMRSAVISGGFSVSDYDQLSALHGTDR